jgi:hypothetical protein
MRYERPRRVIKPIRPFSPSLIHRVPRRLVPSVPLVDAISAPVHANATPSAFLVDTISDTTTTYHRPVPSVPLFGAISNLADTAPARANATPCVDLTVYHPPVTIDGPYTSFVGQCEAVCSTFRLMESMGFAHAVSLDVFEQINKAAHQLVEERGQIAELRHQLDHTNAHVANMSLELIEKDKEIAELQHRLARRDAQLRNLDIDQDVIDIIW